MQPQSGWWARLGLNQRPLPCEDSALPLSYAPRMCEGDAVLPRPLPCQAMAAVSGAMPAGSVCDERIVRRKKSGMKTLDREYTDIRLKRREALGVVVER